MLAVAQGTADRYAALAARAVGAPAALASEVDCDGGSLFFTGSHGIEVDEPTQALAQTICRLVVEAGDVVSIADVDADPSLRELPNVIALGIGAYLGAPVFALDGSVAGVVCALDFTPRTWTAEDEELVVTIAATIGTELELVAASATTERVAAEQKAIIAAALDCIIAMDERGLVLEFNPAAERTFGFTRAEAVGRRLSELIVPPHLRDAHENGLRRYLADGTSALVGRRIELTAMRADESLLPVELTITKVEDANGTMFVGFVRDLTDLRAAQHRYRELLENLPLVTYVNSADEPFSTIYMSPQIEQLFGYTQAEWADDPTLATENIHPDDRERVAALTRVARSQQLPTVGEFRFVRRDGRVVWVLDHTIPVRDHDGVVTGFQGFLLDVTERKELEEQLLQSQKMEAIGQLAGGIAHDFNNMLTAIGGYAELLADALPESDPCRQDVDEIRKAAEHAAALTRQLLAFGRKQVLRPTPLDVNDVVRDLERLLLRTIGPNVRVDTSLDTAVPVVEVDPDQLARVVLNIALNARDAMPSGGTLTIATSRVRRDAGAFAAIEIVDTGVGMSDETRARIFEPFFTTKDEGKGTGLGLATVYGVVAQSGGTIEVDSAVGAGARFRVLLPAAA